jgi:hypothetical protein
MTSKSLIPGFPYLTMKAGGESPEGPWQKKCTTLNKLSQLRPNVEFCKIAQNLADS